MNEKSRSATCFGFQVRFTESLFLNYVRLAD